MGIAATAPDETLLGLCARPTAIEPQLQRVLRVGAEAQAWEWPPQRVEEEGIAPLMRSHLAAAGVVAPAPVERLLQGLWLRHKKLATLRAGVTAELLGALGHAGVEVMLLKGSALWRAVYGDPVLRPMRDIDVLVRPADADKAVAAVERMGFAAREPDPRGHHHVAPRFIARDGVEIGLEVHTSLERGSAEGLDALRADAVEVDVDGARALLPSPTAMLRHVYRHGFCLPIHRAEGFRLIWVADVIGLVETYAGRIDWTRLAQQEPRLLGALPWFGCLTPWAASVHQRVGDPPEPATQLGALSRVSLAAIGSRLPRSMPPSVWLGIRYGITGPQDRRWARARHALEVLTRR